MADNKNENENDFEIIFAKLAEVGQQVPQEPEQMSEGEITEYDEIRALREIVMEVQDNPVVYFSAT